MASKMQKPFLKTTCTSCGLGHYIEDADCGDWSMFSLFNLADTHTMNGNSFMIKYT